jgi:hypothetical protein
MVLMLLMQTACMALPPQVEHEIIYTAKGTRSEARHGHLKIDGREVPWAFSQIVVDGAAYRLRFRTQMWGDDGYHPDPSVPLLPESPVEISEEIAAQGYYCGSRRLRGTPGNWLYVKCAAIGVGTSPATFPAKSSAETTRTACRDAKMISVTASATIVPI